MRKPLVKQTMLERLGAKPCTFRGKMISVEYENGVSTARVNNYVDSCCVMKIVRIHDNCSLVEDGIDDPEHEPWFLIHGEFRGLARYFIVNGNDEYLPVLPNLTGAEFSLMNPQVYKESMRINSVRPEDAGIGKEFMYEWDMFSTYLDMYLSEVNLGNA